MRKTLITAPTSEPVTLTEAKTFARIDCDEDDSLISSLITQAREYAENFTNRKYGSQVWELTLDANEIDQCLQLENFDVETVSSVTVYDEDNVSTLIPTSEYDVYNNRILFDLGVYNIRPIDSMVINYTVGSGVTPEQIKLAILQMVSTWYENREALAMGTIVAMVDGNVMANLAGHTIYSV